MFLVALFVLLYMLFGYIYMLLLLNRIKVCLQSICSQVQEKGRKSEGLIMKSRNYDCTKILTSRFTPLKHFNKERSKYSSFKFLDKEIIKFVQITKELRERFKLNIKSRVFNYNTLPTDRIYIQPIGWRKLPKPSDRMQPPTDRMELTF